jgi:hypothetical protein
LEKKKEEKAAQMKRVKSQNRNYLLLLLQGAHKRAGQLVLSRIMLQLFISIKLSRSTLCWRTSSTAIFKILHL